MIELLDLFGDPGAAHETIIFWVIMLLGGGNANVLHACVDTTIALLFLSNMHVLPGDAIQIAIGARAAALSLCIRTQGG